MACLYFILRNNPNFFIHTSNRLLRCASSYTFNSHGKHKLDISCHGHRHWIHNSKCLVTPENLRGSRETFVQPDPELDWSYLCDDTNLDQIEQNIKNRKGIGDIRKVQKLYKTLKSVQEKARENKKKSEVADLEKELLLSALTIPNRTHSDSPIGDESAGHVTDVVNKEQMETGTHFRRRTVVELGEDMDALRVRKLTLATGSKSYFLKGPFAKLQTALVQYTLDLLLSQGFKLVSVPDVVHTSLVERCGFPVEGERDQVYKIDSDTKLCLAGTGEIPIAGFCMNRVFNIDELPQKLVTVSRCFRAETSTVEEEQGIYRVHQFNKVEMFGVTSQESGDESNQLMDEFMDLQKRLFSPLGFCFRVVNMPTQELGPPAYRKVDMEAWMPGKSFWGEISSTTNCIDFQARRFLVKYKDRNGDLKFCHTINGTACALPRMIMAIAETGQQEDGTIVIPAVLEKYMGQDLLENTPENHVLMKPIKYTRSLRKH